MPLTPMLAGDYNVHPIGGVDGGDGGCLDDSLLSDSRHMTRC